jgi:uncharacterized protein YnzC (UPF0291/DUF896 family)
MYQLDSGTLDDTSLTYCFLTDEQLDAHDGDPPRLEYRQPTVKEYNVFDRERAKYRERLQNHIDERRETVEEEIEAIEEIDGDLDEDIDPDRLKEILLVSGFYPTPDELKAYLDFCRACTVGVQSIAGADGDPIQWSGLDKSGQRDLLQKLGTTPEQRVASLFDYANQIAEGLPGVKKKS